MTRLLWITVAGAFGALARYGLSMLVHSVNARPFPWGTMVVNVIGCFAFGLLWSYFEDRLPEHSEARAAIFIGFLGAFTTFSTYMYETSQLIKQAQWLSVIGNVATQNLVGLAVLLMGLGLGGMLRS